MERRTLGSTIAIAFAALAVVAVPVAGLAATDGGAPTAIQDNETTTESGMNESGGMNDSGSMSDDGTNDSDGMGDNESMDGDEEMNDGEGMDTDSNDESEGGTLDGLGVAAAVLALASLVGYARLR